MGDQKMKEELALFFRSEYKELGLTKDFGAGYEGGRSLWSWNLVKESEPVQRIVEVSIYPTRLMQVKARVAPRDFRQRYRTNEKVIGNLRFPDKPSISWLRKMLQAASQFALHAELLEVEMRDVMPGTYRDTL